MHAINPNQARHTIRQWWFIPFCIGALIVLVWGRSTQWPSPIVERDLHQHRSNRAAPLPNDTLTLSQTFTAQKDGFSELKLWLVRYGEPQPDSVGQLVFTIRDDQGALIAEERRQVRDLSHNDAVRLTFLPQENSAETTYTLTIAGIENSSFSVGGYTLDALDGNFSLSSGETAIIQDLRLTTQYTLTPSNAIRTLLKQIQQNILLFTVTLLFLALPSALIFSMLPRLTSDNSTHVAIMIALGTAIWPIVWTWTTLMNWSWSPVSLWVVFVIGWLIVIARAVQYRRKHNLAWLSTLPSQHTVVLFIILLFSFILRLLAVRDLVFPPWVDSVRHALITVIMSETGQVLQNYRPYLDAEGSLYHFGFHTISASLDLMLNGDMPRMLLMMGQLINTLVLLGIYAAGYLLTRRRGVGLVAAFVVGLPMFFPAYYMSWGRLTQLTGMLILAVLVGLTWRLARGLTTEVLQKEHVHHSNFFSVDVQYIVLTGLLAGGLFLVHFRVFLLYVPVALIIWLFGRPNRQLPMAGFVALFVSFPRIVQFVRITRPKTILTSSPTYNDFPIGYITTAWETPILILTIACAILALLHLSYRYQALNWVIGLGLLAFTLAGEWLGFLPILGNIPFLRTGLVAGLFAFVLGGWQQWIGNWPLLAVSWLAFGHWLRTPEEHAGAIAGAAFMLWVTPNLPKWRWMELIFLNTLWVGLLFILLLGRRIGLPESWVLNTNAMVISLFLPYSLIIGLAAWALWDWFQQQHWLIQVTLYVGFGSLIMYTTLFSVPHQINILNQTTVLAESADLPALEWLDQNLPPDAHIVSSSWRWLNNTWSAQDGSAWLVPLYNRSSTIPPADYGYNPALAAIIRPFNEQAAAIKDWSTPEATQFLRDNGVTHVYIGARSGFLKPEQVAANLAMELLFAENGTFIFALR